ncbi:hypothetical protein DEI82_12410 [Curtobacterium sp. MCBD17_019]|nr:hypothetical protein DEI82_12410 [Curtobacterium sp. MCBD17_019]
MERDDVADAQVGRGGGDGEDERADGRGRAHGRRLDDEPPTAGGVERRRGDDHDSDDREQDAGERSPSGPTTTASDGPEAVDGPAAAHRPDAVGRPDGADVRRGHGGRLHGSGGAGPAA